MKRIFTNFALCCGALLFLGLTANSARADGLVFLGPDPCFPAGVGRGCGDARAPHILSLQSQGKSTTETGGVKYTASGDLRTGDWTRGGNTQTRTLTELGITNASQVQIYFNIIEPNGGNRADVTLNNLRLTAYDETGRAFFIGDIGGLRLQQLGNGQGHSDYVFGLDSAGVARLQAAMAASRNLRLGLEATITNAHGGPESFFIGARPAQTEPIPEPTTMLLLGTGLAGIAASARKRRQKTQQAQQ